MCEGSPVELRFPLDDVEVCAMSNVFRERADQISGAVFMIGMGILFATHFWWPGILFVIGVTSLVRGLSEGRRWYSLQGALWMFALGAFFLMGANVAILFVAIGISMLIGAFYRPPMFAKPQVDNTLE
jgi:hypothetical protein